MVKRDSGDGVELDINDVIREVLALVHDELQTNQIVVVSDLANELPQLEANRVQLQQVLLNLITNAADAMESITDRERLLKVGSGKDDSVGIVITIEDSGSGIAQENIDRIFDPFFTTKSEGMGLGLSICRSIIQAHEGRLLASRRNPYGSVFRVFLPAGEPRGLSHSAIAGGPWRP